MDNSLIDRLSLIQWSISAKEDVAEEVVQASLRTHRPNVSNAPDGVVGSSNKIARSISVRSAIGSVLPVASSIRSSNTSGDKDLRGPKLYVKSLRLAVVVLGDSLR